MAPFSAFGLLSGLKERIEYILLQGDTLYLGTSTGALNSYIVERDGEKYAATPLDPRPNFVRGSIEQLDYIRDVNSLVSLADGVVTLSPLPTLAPQTPLTQARNALSFTIHVSVSSSSDSGDEKDDASSSAPPKSTTSTTNLKTSPSTTTKTVLTQLAIGCRKKLVIYSWKNGEPQEVKELKLPHSPRNLAFCTPNMLILGYTPTDHAIVYLSTMSVAELSLPTLPASSSTAAAGGGMGKALTGLGGYVVGLASKVQKPSVFRLEEGEVCVTKDNSSFFIGPEGKLSREVGMNWPAVPDDIAFARPYILSSLPAPGPTVAASLSTLGSSISLQRASAPDASSTAQPKPPATDNQPRIQIRSALSMGTVQTLTYPFAPSSFSSSSDTTSSSDPTPPATLRLLTPSPSPTTSSTQSPLFVLSTPTDRASATAQGSKLWVLSMQDWTNQVDELVREGRYADALGLIGSVGEGEIVDKVPARIRTIRALHAVQIFAKGSYDEAINVFLELDVNPAKVIALYPESVSGRMCVGREEREGLFLSGWDGKKESGEETKEKSDDAGVKDDSSTATPPPAEPGADKRAIESLLRYLADRRPTLSGALSQFSITPSSSHLHPTLSSRPVSSLFALPDFIPISQLVPEQLLSFAQLVDTALFRAYLVVRPGLVGSLCRIENWCEVGEVEEELRAREKYTDLIDLYKGKKMHEKAMKLIHELSLEEDDVRDRLEPAIRYLQRLGPDYLQLIFENAKWVLEVDQTLGLQIFTTEEAPLPRSAVSEFLMSISPALCAGYMEYLIDEAGDANPAFHDRLAELYLRAVMDGRSSEELREEAHTKLVHFIRTSEYYDPGRLFGRLPGNALFEVRAILLGKLGRHEAALEIYVYRLHDYDAAEEYCKTVYQKQPDPKGVFLSLLRIYLRPSPDSVPPASRATSPTPSISAPSSESLLIPALELIARHSSRIDSSSILSLLPPLVPTSSVQAFLFDVLDPSRRNRKADGEGMVMGGRMGQVVREVWKARKLEVDSRNVGLRSRRVRVTDTRICPQCHKRIGNNVIAVHSPRGEVTHYGCREAFAAQKRVLDTSRT